MCQRATLQSFKLSANDYNFGFLCYSEQERRILIIGKTGHGKSATANSLLGRDVFKSSGYTESETNQCGYDKSLRFGKKLVIVDTPGFFDTRLVDDDIRKELIRSCALLSPGPHAILLVYKTGERFTQENIETVQKYLKLFGQDVSNYMFLILSHWDQAPPEVVTPENYIRRGSEQLKDLEKMCKGGCYTIRNKRKKKTKQVERIIEGIDCNLDKLKGKCFTAALFRGIEACIFVEEAAKRVGSPLNLFRRIPESEEEIEAVRSSAEYIESEPRCLSKRDEIRRKIADEKIENKGIFARIVAWFRRLFAGLI